MPEEQRQQSSSHCILQVLRQPEEAPWEKEKCIPFLWVRLLGCCWASSSLHQLFCRHRREGLCLGLCSPTWRAGSCSGGNCWCHPALPFSPRRAELGMSKFSWAAGSGGNKLHHPQSQVCLNQYLSPDTRSQGLRCLPTRSLCPRRQHCCDVLLGWSLGPSTSRKALLPALQGPSSTLTALAPAAGLSIGTSVRP